jgi:sec-independent protein translocase protein TatA
MGHWFEILIILALALLVFGPKRMIEMGSSLGKAFRELRNAAKEMDWSSLTGQNESTTTPSPPPGPRYKDTPPPNSPVAAPPPPPEGQIVEGSLVDAPDIVTDVATPPKAAPTEQAHPNAEAATKIQTSEAQATERSS